MEKTATGITPIKVTHVIPNETTILFINAIGFNPFASSSASPQKGHSPLFEIALVLVCLDHVASVIVNANYGIM
jgi:hypothetical protein